MPRALLALTLVAACLAAVPGAANARSRAPDRVQLLSASFGGGFPNGPSHDGVLSQDRQLATLAAFDSDASNIVKGDTNGVSDVFLVHRAGKISDQGPPWVKGRTELISRAPGGGPANGPSYLPDIDGEQAYGPRCVAFISQASNLVPGDTNGVADAFVYFVRTHKIRRVSVGSYGQQANGATYEVKVDGHCDRVAFVSDATNLGLQSTTNKSWKSAVTGVPQPGVRQVYVHILDNSGDNRGLAGMTFLASASATGEPGNGDSTEISFARSGGGCGRQGRCGQFSGEAVFFASQASNLASGDTNGVSDVFMRAFPRRFVRLRHLAIRGVGPLQLTTRLISAAPGGRAADGPSDQPAANDSGEFVAYRTAAGDLFGGDASRGTQVVRTSTFTGQTVLVSRTPSGAPANGDSSQPVIGRTGQDLLFASTAGIDQNDRNCQTDIYHLDIPHNRQILTSLDSINRVPNFIFGSRQQCPSVIAAPIVKPGASYYLNYAVWETSWPLMDAQLAAKRLGRMTNDQAARLSTSSSSLHQVYLRYLGPR